MREKLQIPGGEVNPFGLGTNTIGSPNINPEISDVLAKDILREGLSVGLNFIDTAFYYGLGHSEEVVGAVLKEMGMRSKVLLATKGGHREEGTTLKVDNHPDFLVQSVHQSLRRLQTDYLDVFYIHFPDEDTPKYEAVGALQRLKEEGLLRAIGVSNFSLPQLIEADRDGYVDVVQDEYHLLNREKEQDFIPYLMSKDIRFINYYPLASGLLTGKYRPDSPISDKRSRKPQFQGEAYARNLEKVEALRTMALEKGVEVFQLVLAWYVATEFIFGVIPGAKSLDQVRGNLSSRDVKLTEEEFAKIDTLFR